jgi:putative ABC transport system permease protein
MSQCAPKPQPPRWLDKLVERFCSPHLLEQVMGDLHERFSLRVKKEGVAKARSRYWREVLAYMRPVVFKRKTLIHAKLLSTDMFANDFKIAWRNLVKGKIYSVVNILGLAVGIACGLIILLYIGKELSYDQFHSKAGRIYRISLSFSNSNGGTTVAWAPGPLGPALQAVVPEVEAVAQLSSPGAETIVERNELKIYEPGFVYATPSFFELFDFPLVSGDGVQSLKEPYNVLLSESMAAKYFPQEDPLGKMLRVNNEQNYHVTGIFKDIPDHSHIRFDFVASRESQFASGLERDDWRSGGAHTYVLLEERANPEIFKSKLDAFRDEYMAGPFNIRKGKESSMALTATPLTGIHLYTNFSSELSAQGDITYVRIFSAIALLILVIACINYTNLATARAVKRAREVGIRKASGASKRELIRQYLSESFLFVSISLGLALILSELVLPTANQIMQRTMVIDWADPFLFLTFGGLWVILGLGAGVYPALYLSRFNPVRALKNAEQVQSRGMLRKVLITFQLTVSIALIACTLVIESQMELVRDSRPGFNQQQVIMIPTRNEIAEDYAVMRKRLLACSGIASVTTSSFEPGEAGLITFFSADDIEGLTGEETFVMDGIIAGFDFEQTFELKIVQGRAFTEAFKTDLEQAVIVNEAAAQRFGWEEAVGKTIRDGETSKRVVGVVEDFHYKTLKEEIVPLIILPTDKASRFIVIRLEAGDIPFALEQVASAWHEIIPQLPFTYSFLDESFDTLYKTEMRLNALVTVFSLLAIFIACLGLLGLSAFMAEQRTKEIGIRKVLGATVQNILTLLTKDFVKWAGLGFIIAIPFAHYAMSQWLRTFKYRVEVGGGMYLAAGAIAFILVVLATTWQSMRTALMNPVNSLKNE